MLKAGANINHANKEGNVALTEAIRKHDLDTVQMLLQVPKINIRIPYNSILLLLLDIAGSGMFLIALTIFNFEILFDVKYIVDIVIKNPETKPIIKLEFVKVKYLSMSNSAKEPSMPLKTQIII